MKRASRPLALLSIVVLLALAGACGAKTGLHAPASTTGGGGAAADSSSTSTGEMRVCAPNCTVGHRCCVGGCNGPAAITESDCCACLLDEVSSSECANEACGG